MPTTLNLFDRCIIYTQMYTTHTHIHTNFNVLTYHEAQSQYPALILGIIFDIAKRRRG